MLHRSEAEPEFAEHKKLVDQAILLLKMCDDSTLALRGMQLLSSLLEGRKRQNARNDKEHRTHPQEGQSLAWPLEDRQSIDAMWTSKQSYTGDEGFQPTASTVAFAEGTQLSSNPAPSFAGDAGVLDPLIPNSESDIVTDGSKFDTMTENGALPDGSWWMDLFSDYFPAESGFQNPCLIEDLFAQAP